MSAASTTDSLTRPPSSDAPMCAEYCPPLLMSQPASSAAAVPAAGVLLYLWAPEMSPTCAHDVVWLFGRTRGGVGAESESPYGAGV